jgi:hypothetical protein
VRSVSRLALGLDVARRGGVGLRRVGDFLVDWRRVACFLTRRRLVTAPVAGLTLTPVGRVGAGQ